MLRNAGRDIAQELFWKTDLYHTRKEYKNLFEKLIFFFAFVRISQGVGLRFSLLYINDTIKY